MAIVGALSLISDPNKRRFGKLAIAALFGMVFSLTSLNNWQFSQRMLKISEVWEGARNYACSDVEIPSDDRLLQKIIDPQGLISFHHTTDKAEFWRTYLRYSENHTDCSTLATVNRARNAHREPIVYLDKAVSISPTNAIMFLGSGWSHNENWGVWTDAHEAELFLKPAKDINAERLELVISYRMNLDRGIQSQRLEILQDGEMLLQKKFEYDQNLFWTVLTIPLRAPSLDQVMTITFNLPDATRPTINNDTRTLGLALRSFELRRAE